RAFHTARNLSLPCFTRNIVLDPHGTGNVAGPSVAHLRDRTACIARQPGPVRRVCQQPRAHAAFVFAFSSRERKRPESFSPHCQTPVAYAPGSKRRASASPPRSGGR